MKQTSDIPSGTPFQQRVWRELLKIPKGSVTTYASIAKRVGKPKAVRAVANAIAANPWPLRIPCHRVIRSDGKLGGYSGPGGTAGKRKLLRNEGAIRSLSGASLRVQSISSMI
jgi:methylated-DNA-[protein]-cysteine S-methyltransferase